MMAVMMFIWDLLVAVHRVFFGFRSWCPTWKWQRLTVKILASASALRCVELGWFSWSESDDAWARVWVDISIDCVVHYSSTTAFDGARYTKVVTTQRCCCLDVCRSMTGYGPGLKLFVLKSSMSWHRDLLQTFADIVKYSSWARMWTNGQDAFRSVWTWRLAYVRWIFVKY